MSENRQPAELKKLHKELKGIIPLEVAARETGRRTVRLGVALLFLIAVVALAAFKSGGAENALFIVAAGLLGGYMAMNIGANDVANNVGPAVGSKALTMMGALLIAAVCEAAGALIAGGDVVRTVSGGIVNPDLMPDGRTFIMVMMSALLAAALWINIATVVGAPVSTTHSVVGGVMGGGIAAVGFVAVNWPTMSKIAASWVISPLMGGLVAAAFLAFIKFTIIYRDDKITAARRWVPVLVGILAGAFAMYLVIKGLRALWRPEPWMVLAIGAASFAVATVAVRPLVVRASSRLENRRKAISELFTIPLIFAAALLSFAHGANDVANAVGPLAAIVSTADTGIITTSVHIPLWVMAVGAAGITMGLLLFGPKMVRMVGEKITRLDRVRAFTVALSAAITVLIASWLGLPVSSTHIAVGAVFGVGFFREFLTNRKRAHKALAARLAADDAADASRLDEACEVRKAVADAAEKEAKRREKSRHRRLVRRAHLLTIVSAWVITVPSAALLSAFLFFLMNRFV